MSSTESSSSSVRSMAEAILGSKSSCAPYQPVRGHVRLALASVLHAASFGAPRHRFERGQRTSALVLRCKRIAEHACTRCCNFATD